MDNSYKYAAVERYLRDRIAAGAYRGGLPVESESALAEQFSLTRATVRHALTRLEREGLIERRQGKRSYVPEEKPLYAGRRHDRVGFITYDPGYFDMQDLSCAVHDEMHAAGYEVEMRYVTEAILDERRALLDLLELPLDGLIIEGVGTAMPTFNIDLFRKIEAMQLPMVFTDGYHHNVHAAHVVANDRATICSMVDHLAALGHRDIGGIFAHGQSQGAMRFQGYLDGLHKNGLGFDDQCVLFLAYADKRFIFDNLFNAYRERLLQCTAFVCYSDSYADFLEATLLRNGISVPEGVSVTGMDNLPQSRIGHIKLTTATLPLRAMGESAARTLIQMIQTRRDVGNTVLDCEFVKGDSTRSIL